MAIIFSRPRPDVTRHARLALGEWITRMHKSVDGWASGPVHLVVALGTPGDDAYVARLVRQGYPPTQLAPRVRMFAVPEAIAALLTAYSDRRVRYRDLGPPADFIDLGSWLEELRMKERIADPVESLEARIAELIEAAAPVAVPSRSAARAAGEQTLPGFDVGPEY